MSTFDLTGPVEVKLLPEWDGVGEALPTWTYGSEELLELEYEAFFLNSWQMVGHVCDLPKPGDFITFDMWRDSVIVVRGKDDVIRAFLNVCRHRAMRLLDEGKGNCGSAIQCPYHGWTYRNDGTLRGVTQPENFPNIDKSTLGLQEVRMTIHRGQIFVNFSGGGASIEDTLGVVSEQIAPYSPETYVPHSEPTFEIWNCNWKLAWDNYQENYHIPIGHPGLQRMVESTYEGPEYSGGFNYGYFAMRDKPSKVPHERRYQELIGCTDYRFPEGRQRMWLQLALDPNMGIEYYPDIFALFQVLPLGVDKTMIKILTYSPANLSAQEKEMQEINSKLLHEVNDQDKMLVEGIQRGVNTSGYQPGPLALEESAVFGFHERIRELIPVARLPKAPLKGTLQQENERLKQQTTTATK
ncbi:MAG: aromatic ring-hydroxylating dioxygenase subunit alpha [Pseudomonadales bacterium]